MLARLNWLSILKTQDIQVWQNQELHKHSDHDYFCYKPNLKDWAILVLMCQLNFINLLYYEPTRTKLLSLECYEKIRDRYSKLYFNIISFQNAIRQYLVLIVVATIFYFISKAQSNFVNWLMFVLNILLCAFLVKGDGKESTYRHSMHLAWCIKIYSFIILLAEIAFISFVGVSE